MIDSCAETDSVQSTVEPEPGEERRPAPRRRRDQRGEGVISAAIAVLVMAFIGVGMWVAFNTMFQHTATNINHQVNDCIGQTSSSC